MFVPPKDKSQANSLSIPSPKSLQAASTPVNASSPVSQQPFTPTPIPVRAARPAAVKANQQSWERSFSGTAKGVNFQLRIQRDPNGYLHARYQTNPGKAEGWHLEGQLRDDNTFALTGTDNDATFEGKLGPGGSGITARFTNKNFTVEKLTLMRVTPKVSVQPAQPKPDPVPTPQPPVTQPPGTQPPGAGTGPAPADPDLAPPTWNAQGTGLKNFDRQPEVQKAILWGAEQLHINPNALAAVIGYETGGSFSPSQENAAAKKAGKKGAVGFIQFTPSVGIPALNQYLKTVEGAARAKQLGITAQGVTRDDLLQMTPAEQMKYVVLYFNIPVNRLNPGDSYAGIYQEILAPGRESDVWYSKDAQNSNYASNRQFDQNNDGQITAFEAAKEIRDQGFVQEYYTPSVNNPELSQQKSEPITRQDSQSSTVQLKPNSSEPQSFDQRVTKAISDFTAAYNFTVTSRWMSDGVSKSNNLQIRTPYFINIGSMLKTVAGNRAKMSAKDYMAFREAPGTAKIGKASPDQMQAFTQKLIDINPFGVEASKINSVMVTGWLKRYGIGVDCSGFVTQALDYATTSVVGQDPHIGDARVRVNRGSGSLAGGQGEFIRITKPEDVRPGDTMWLDGHIRIVVRVGAGPEGKGVQMLIAESTPNEQMPASLALGGVYRNGVDQSIWWFPIVGRFSSKGVKKKTSGYNWEAQKTDIWATPNTLDIETFTFGRYKPLAAGDKGKP